ncbi:MAG: carboxylate-amine ligase, partial [Steroidobacteraceae bacterium]
LALVKEDAEVLECQREIEHVRTILSRGTSAHRQVRTFDAARSGGATQREALQAVVDFLIRETAAGL